MKRTALLLLGLGSPLLLLSLLIGGGWAGTAFVLVSLLFPTALCIAGAAGGAGSGAVWRWLLPTVGLVLLLSGAGLLLLHVLGDGGARFLGLPPATLLLLGGLGLLPLLLTGLGYAADFRSEPGENRPPSGPSGPRERG